MTNGPIPSERNKQYELHDEWRLTVGTRDGATIEMAERAGEDNFFLFGLNVEQVENSRGCYAPHWHDKNGPETRAALDLVFSDYCGRNQPGIFAPLRDKLLDTRRTLHAPGRPRLLLPASERDHRFVLRSGRVGPQSNPESGELGEVFKRPHPCRVHSRHLEEPCPIP